MVATSQPTLQVSNDPQVQQHYATQVALSLALLQVLDNLTPSLDVRRLSETLTPLLQAVAPIVQKFSQAAINESLNYYERLRSGVTVPFRAPVVDAKPVSQIEAYMQAAIANRLSTGVVNQIETFQQQLVADIEAAAQQIVTDASRAELLTAASSDPQSIGWIRVARPGACAFCLMLATRAVQSDQATADAYAYKSEKAASFKAHTRFNGRGGDCQCTAHPIFLGQKVTPPADIIAAKKLWDSSTKDAYGPDKLNAFRRALAAQRSPSSPTENVTALPKREALTALLTSLQQAA